MFSTIEFTRHQRINDGSIEIMDFYTELRERRELNRDDLAATT